MVRGEANKGARESPRPLHETWRVSRASDGLILVSTW
jgi:hypothetical protein